MNNKLDVDVTIKKIIKALTLQEKASLTSGESYWATKSIKHKGIPNVVMTDGPHGLRREDSSSKSEFVKNSFKATCFPTAATTACSWNPLLLEEMGKAIADEAKNQNVDIVLGPGINIKRSPLCGRNFEYFSEEPLLAGRLASAFICGVEKEGVGTCLKHFAVNSQEYLRMSISEVVDERALFEIYFAAFEECISKTKPAAVMCSYNRINGEFSSENKMLLTDTLRDRWGYDGIVISDWGAVNDRVKGIKAGLDLEMPTSFGYTDKQIVEAVEKGRLDMSELDKVVERLLRFIFTYSKLNKDDYAYDYDKSHALARKIADESVVLLKNEDKTLPLAKSGEKLAVIGEFARTPRYQGSGSSRINPMKLVNLTDELDKKGIKYDFAQGYTLTGDGYDEKLILEAVEVAKECDKIVLLIGLTDEYESEGYDRRGLGIPRSHIELIERLSLLDNKLIVVLQGGSPIEMPWIDKVDGVLNMYLTGECFGESLYDILFGDCNPSGKLAETYPIALEDSLADKYYRMGPTTVEHRESIFVGYRYYDTANKEVLFPFGYGLSYTQFEITELRLSTDSYKQGQARPFEVSCNVTNTGDREGMEVVQVYVRDLVSTAYMPEKKLAGFFKVKLRPNETKSVKITLDDRAFGYYSVTNGKWVVEDGEFEIAVGNSSRSLSIRERIYVTSNEENIKHDDFRHTAAYYYKLTSTDYIPDNDFQSVLGHAIPDSLPKTQGDFDISSTLNDIADTFVGRLFRKYAPRVVSSRVKDADATTLAAINSGFYETPLRALPNITQGIISYEMVNCLVKMANGHNFIGGTKLLLHAPSMLSRSMKLSRMGKKQGKDKK